MARGMTIYECGCHEGHDLLHSHLNPRILLLNVGLKESED